MPSKCFLKGNAFKGKLFNEVLPAIYYAHVDELDYIHYTKILPYNEDWQTKILNRLLYIPYCQKYCTQVFLT